MKSRFIFLVVLVFVMIPTIAQAEVYSRAKTRTIVADACRYYHRSKADTAWLQKTAIDIVYTGRHESGGSTRAGIGHECVGILQFDSGWHLTKSLTRLKARLHIRGPWRESGKLSLYRFVKSYKDGGKAAIRRHWKATLGR